MGARKAVLYTLWGLIFVVCGGASGIVVEHLMPGSASYAWILGLVIWYGIWRAVPKWLQPATVRQDNIRP